MGTTNPTPRQDKAPDTQAVSRGPGAQMRASTHAGGWTSRLQSWSEVYLEVQDQQQCGVVPRPGAVYLAVHSLQAVPVQVN